MILFGSSTLPIDYLTKLSDALADPIPSDLTLSSSYSCLGYGFRPMQEPANSEGRLMFHFTERTSLSLFSLNWEGTGGVTPGGWRVRGLGFGWRRTALFIWRWRFAAAKAGVISSSIL